MLAIRDPGSTDPARPAVPIRNSRRLILIGFVPLAVAIADRRLRSKTAIDCAASLSGQPQYLQLTAPRPNRTYTICAITDNWRQPSVGQICDLITNRTANPAKK